MNIVAILMLVVGLVACGVDGRNAMDGGDGTDAAAHDGGSASDADMLDSGSAGAGGSDGGMGCVNGDGDAGEETVPNGGMTGGPMCDPLVASVASCGGTCCPGRNDSAVLQCIVNCCVDDQCGTRTAMADQPPTSCVVPPPSDDRCPDYVEDQGGLRREGCCTANNECGIVSTILMDCITASPLVTTLPATPPTCDGSPLDAGP